jgi:hypothetical protein
VSTNLSSRGLLSTNCFRLYSPLMSNVERPLSLAATGRSWPIVLIRLRSAYDCNQPVAATPEVCSAASAVLRPRFVMDRLGGSPS